MRRLLRRLHKYHVYGFFVLLALSFVWSSFGFDRPAPAGQKDAPSKTVSSNGVKVRVTYWNPQAKGAPLFGVSLDSDSVDLSAYNLGEATFLRDDSGVVYKGEVLASSGGGRHKDAAIVFKNAVASSAEYLQFVLKGVAGINEMVFRFDVPRPSDKPGPYPSEPLVDKK